MRIQPHGLPDNIRRLGFGPGQQPHFIHGIEQLPMGGLEPVDFGQRAGNNDAHCIGHIVLLERLGNRLFHDDAGPCDIRVGIRFSLRCFFLFRCHECAAFLSSNSLKRGFDPFQTVSVWIS